MTDSETWFDAIGRVGATIEGVRHVHAGGRGGAGSDPGEPEVEPMVDDLIETPALILGYGGAEVTAGSWERQKHTVNAAIWIEREPIDASYSEAIRFVDRVLAAFPPRARAFNVHAALQSVLVTGFGDLTSGRWPASSERAFLVLPFTVEAVVNRAAQYAPS